MAERPVKDLLNFRLPEFKLNPQQRRTLGNRIVQVLRNRLMGAVNVFDQPATAYSPKGPIYMPLTWGAHVEKTGSVGVRIPGRGQRELRGRYGIRRTDYQKYLTSLGYPVKLGGRINKVYRNLRSGKFENYAEFKKFIGHSGERDLSLTGKMLADIAVVAETDTHVEVGFNSEEQQQKMKGNLKHESSWGLSDRDRVAIKETFDQLAHEVIQEWGKF